MEVLVDTSIWIDYFRGGGNSKDLDFLIDEDLIVTNDIILAELIPHLKIKMQMKVIELLHEVNKISLDIHWEEIIEFQVKCLKGGANGVGIPDLIIAQNAKQNNCKVYSLDKIILSPTDAALGQAVVESDDVPQKTKDSIAVESGLNDGIALPPILACMSALSASAGANLDTGYWAEFALKQIAYAPVLGGSVGLLGGVLVDRASKRGWSLTLSMFTVRTSAPS